MLQSTVAKAMSQSATYVTYVIAIFAQDLETNEFCDASLVVVLPHFVTVKRRPRTVTN